MDCSDEAEELGLDKGCWSVVLPRGRTVVLDPGGGSRHGVAVGRQGESSDNGVGSGGLGAVAEGLGCLDLAAGCEGGSARIGLCAVCSNLSLIHI